MPIAVVIAGKIAAGAVVTAAVAYVGATAWFCYEFDRSMREHG